MSHSRIVLSLAALASIGSAQQDPSCTGDGVGQAYLIHGQARIGGTLAITMGSPAAPNGVGVLSVSDGFGPVVFPTPALGTICLDVFSGGYFTELVFFDATGNVDLDTDPQRLEPGGPAAALHQRPGCRRAGAERPRLAVSHAGTALAQRRRLPTDRGDAARAFDARRSA